MAGGAKGRAIGIGGRTSHRREDEVSAAGRGGHPQAATTLVLVVGRGGLPPPDNCAHKDDV
jgi:hypothetical protein